MNKYFYPIYKMKLKPWIKYWLIKKTSVKPVSGTYTRASGASPLTILKALKAPIRDINLYGDCKQVEVPSPTNPSEVQTITGQTSFTISDGTSSTFSIIPLGSIELCKIGEYSDRIFKSPDNKWYLEKNIGKKVFVGVNADDGTWSKASAGYYQCSASLGSISSAGALCDHYIYGDLDVVNNFTITTNAFRVNDSTDTLDNYKTWLGTHNVTLYYVLSSAVVTEITDNLLLTILNGLENLETFKGTNEITFSDLSPNISFEYLKEDEV